MYGEYTVRTSYLYEREGDAKKREWVEALGSMQELDILYLVMLNVDDFTPLSQLFGLEENGVLITGNYNHGGCWEER